MTHGVVTRRLVRSGGNPGGNRHATPTEGGVWHKQRAGCGTHPFHVSPSLFGCFVLTRLTRAAPAVRDKTGATPLFWPLVRLGEEGGVAPGVAPGVAHPSRQGGSLPSVCIPAGRLTRPSTGARRRADESRDA